MVLQSHGSAADNPRGSPSESGLAGRRLDGLLALSVSAEPGLALAQEATASQLDEIVELARIDLKKQRVLVVGEAMEFSGEEAAAFWPIYKEYEAEFTKQGDARLARQS